MEKNEVSIQDKIKIIFGILGIFLVISLIGFYVYWEFFRCDRCVDDVRGTNQEISYRQEEDKFIFYSRKTNDVISEYECLNRGCGIAVIGDLHGNRLANNLFLINENEGVLINDNVIPNSFVLFDMLNGEVIFRTSMMAFAGDNHYVYRYDENFGIIDLHGNIVTGTIFDGGLSIHRNGRVATGGLENNYIAAAIDGAWGLVDLRTGEAVIDFEFDMLNAFESNYVSVKKENAWHILNIYNAEIVAGGYQEVVILQDFYLASSNNHIHLYNTNGEQLTNIHIPLGAPFSQVVCHTGHGLSLEFDGDDYLVITIDYEAENHGHNHGHDHSHGNVDGTTRRWRFNINTSEINEIQV